MRLGRPVSASWVAWWVSSDSARRRSVTSSTVAIHPVTWSAPPSGTNLASAQRTNSPVWMRNITCWGSAEGHHVAHRVHQLGQVARIDESFPAVAHEADRRAG